MTMTRDVHLANADNHCLFDLDTTPNHVRMAEEAGISDLLWHPYRLDVTKAAHVVAPLRAGLILLISDPKRFEAFDPSNGWGEYEGFVCCCLQYLKACLTHPEADVFVD